MRGRPMLGAHVAAGAAMWLARRVPPSEFEDAVRWARRIGRDDLAREIERAGAEVREAGRRWLEEEQGNAPASEAGSAEGALPSRLAPSDRDLLTTADAAGLLGVSSRRVRQLLACGQLAGRRCGSPPGQWLVDPDSINALAARKELSA